MKHLITLIFSLLLAYAANAQDENFYYVHNDHNGTPIMLTDENQHVVWKAHYTPYGEAIIEVEEIEFPIRGQGQYYDKESGLHHNYYRDLNARRGSYEQADRIGMLRDYSDPQLQVAMRMGIPLDQGGAGNQLNQSYAYANSNPIMNFDPFGLETGEVSDYRAWSRYNTGDYSAGIEYSQPDTRTLEEIDCGQCNFVCSILVPGPIIPLSKKGLIEYFGWYGPGKAVCNMACKDRCGKNECKK